MSAPDAWAELRAHVEPQRGYLRTPLPPGPGVCHVCRGPASAPYSRCYQCEQQHRSAGGVTADVVAFISYAVKEEQHAHNLAVYKASYSPALVRTRLISLLTVFMVDHLQCLWQAAGVMAAHTAAVVPSTRGRTGPHPLQSLIGARVGLPWLPLAADPSVTSEGRDFHPGRFSVPAQTAVPVSGTTVLLFDDTWTTGSRVQSAAFALKAAGAARVVAVVLGRHARPKQHAPWKPIIDATSKHPYDPAICSFHQ